MIASVQINRPNLRFPFPDGLSQGLQNVRCLNLIRRGKYMVWEFAGDVAPLVVHLGMSGSFRVEGGGVEVCDKKHDHLRLTTDAGAVVTYNDPRRFGFFQAAPMDWAQYPAFQAMGPEPLGNDFHGPALHAALQKRKTPVKVALLDQAVVAGVGNIYACEALYRASIDPRRASHTIKADEAESLAAAIKDVLQAAILSGGSSLRDHLQTNGTMGYFQHQFDVYDQEGKKCSICHNKTIIRMVQAGRSTFFCDGHQR